MKEYLTALKYLEGMQSWKNESLLYYKLYGNHAELNDLPNEDKYARLCLATALKSNNAEAICLAWQAMASNYTDQYEAGNNKLLLDSALYAGKQSLQVFKQQEDYIILQSQFAIVALNIASLYYLNIKPLQADSMKHYLQLAMVSGNKNNNTAVQVNSLAMLSHYQRQQGNMAGAESSLLQAKQIAENVKVKEHAVLHRLYLSLSEFYEETGHYQNALQYYKQSKDAFATLNNVQKQADIHLLEAQFNMEKKEQALYNMTQKATFRMKQIYLYIGIIILAFAGLLFMFRSYNYRLKYSIKKQQLLQTEKEEASLLAKLQEEERARLYLQKQDAELRAQLHQEHVKLKTEEAARLAAEAQLIQTQKEQLQKELLAGALHLEHKNDMLQNLKEKLQTEQISGKATRQLHKIINEEIRLDEDFENLKTELKDVHPQFFSRIQQHSKQKLTALDLKYCAYISMKLSTKQMALLLHVEPTSIRMNKYRIKQKMGLAKEDDLESFIARLSEI
ncbi:MAG: hypothetical protein EOO03_10880 [Chitinophagaceae bacterium]|nr:MAG: hypothetical protein EOO03_10880 [Chitinophagaceae bacterium]